MASHLIRLASRLLEHSHRSLPRILPSLTGGNVHDSADFLEEQWEYKFFQDAFYPERLGDIFRDTYEVLGKLGYGGSSTVWFGRDLAYN
jgi:Fe-S oxidoreductase